MHIQQILYDAFEFDACRTQRSLQPILFTNIQSELCCSHLNASYSAAVTRLAIYMKPATYIPIMDSTTQSRSVHCHHKCQSRQTEYLLPQMLTPHAFHSRHRSNTPIRVYPNLEWTKYYKFEVEGLKRVFISFFISKDSIIHHFLTCQLEYHLFRMDRDNYPSSTSYKTKRSNPYHNKDRNYYIYG
jgi:hypothetical protein